MGDGWAWISLSGFSENMRPGELAAQMPAANTTGKDDRIAVVEFPEASMGRGLEALLDSLEGYLRAHRERLVALEDRARFQVRIGWCPASPQESLVIRADLLRMIGEIRADIMLDSYTE